MTTCIMYKPRTRFVGCGYPSFKSAKVVSAAVCQPHFRRRSETVVLWRREATVTFECPHAAGSPADLSYRWYNSRASGGSNRPVFRTRVLRVDSQQLKSTEVYTCVVRNVISRRTDKFHLIIISPWKQPAMYAGVPLLVIIAAILSTLLIFIRIRHRQTSKPNRFLCGGNRTHPLQSHRTSKNVDCERQLPSQQTDSVTDMNGKLTSKPAVIFVNELCMTRKAKPDAVSVGEYDVMHKQRLDKVELWNEEFDCGGAAVQSSVSTGTPLQRCQHKASGAGDEATYDKSEVLHKQRLDKVELWSEEFDCSGAAVQSSVFTGTSLHHPRQ